MLCPACAKENPSENAFCNSCGASLLSEQPDAPTADEPAETGATRHELRAIRREIASLTRRVTSLEGGSAQQAQPAVAPIVPAAAPAAAPQPAGSTYGAAQPPKGDRPLNWWDTIDWEAVLGKNWFAIIGAIALAVGTGFFLRMAFENDWIGETGRVVLGLVGGVALVAVGEYTARRYAVWAQAVTGGGISILYLSIYAAFGFYTLIDPVAAFLFLGLVVATSGLLALRYESLVIALLSIFGAFLTPMLLDKDLGDQRYLLLAYILIVDLGILGVSTFRNWRWFTLVGLLASYALLGSWLGYLSDDDRMLAQAGASGVFVIFVGATTLFHVIWRHQPKPTDRALMSINAVAYYAVTYGVLWEEYQDWFGLITLGLALFYGLVGYAALKRSGTPPEIALNSLTTALVFVTIAAPLQLTGTWITVAWATEGAVLVWVGFTVGSARVRMFALGVFAIAGMRLLFLDTFAVTSRDFTPFLNDRFPTFAVAVAALYVALFLYRRERSQIEEWERSLETVFALAANAFTLWALSAEIINFFERRELEAGIRSDFDEARNAKFSALTVLWAVYAAGLVAIAFARRSVILRWVGLALVAAAAAKLMLVDTFVIGVPRGAFTAFINFYFVSLVVVLAVVIFTAYRFGRGRGSLLLSERYVYTTLVVLANLVALWAFSAESWRYFANDELRTGTDLLSARHLSLTVLWAAYAIGVIAVGIWRNSHVVRMSGIGLLAVPVAKLFVFDVFLLERGYRVAAFVTLGALLLALGLAYQRYSEVMKGFFFGKPR